MNKYLDLTSRRGCSGLTGAVLTGAAAIGVGAYHGFTDAQGTPVPKESLVDSLPIFFIIANMPLGSTYGQIVGWHKVYSSNQATRLRNKKSEKYLAETAFKSSVIGGAVGSAAGAAVGGLEVAVGYGIGYVVGTLMK